MRRESPDLAASTVAWLRGRLVRGWRTAVALGLGARLAALAGLVGLIVAAGYGLAPDVPGAMVPLYDGFAFAPGEVAKIGKVLDVEAIAWSSVRGRIEVKRPGLAEVQTLLAKRGLAPPTLKVVRDRPHVQGILELPADALERRNREREQVLEAAIADIDPTLQADVQVLRSRSRGLRPVEDLKVTVRLTADDDRPISAKATEAIATLLFSMEPNLKPDGLWILDRKVHVYHSPTSSALSPHSRARAREDELSGKILEQLAWIKGVLVSVSVDAAATAGVDSPGATTAPELTVNRPLDEPRPAATIPAPLGVGKAKVFVQIPAGFVVERFRAVAPESKPTPRDLEPLFVEARDKVEKVVRNVVPSAELGSVEVSRIEITGSSFLASPRTEQGAWRVPPSWQTAAGGAAAAGMLLVAVGFGLWLATRRTPARPVSASRRPRARTAAAAGPAERVRELVRLDPAAAAGVLHRWIGQGGDAA